MAADTRESPDGPDHPEGSESTVPSATEEAAALRRRAEEEVHSRQAEATEEPSPQDARRPLHEVQVYQVELEMQNEELRRTREVLETSRLRYIELYDRAPVGYVTLSEEGVILEANLTAMALLGASTGALVAQPLSRFVLREDQDILYRHRREVFAVEESRESDLRLVHSGGTPLWVRLHSIAARPEKGEAPYCRTVIRDVTERKLAEAECDSLLSEVRGLAARLAEVEEAQRKDLARELHDRVGQNLTALGLILSVLRNRLSEGELTRVGSNIDDAALLLVETTNEVRQVMTELRPPMLDEYGLLPALEWFAGVFSERAGVKVTVAGSEPSPRLGSRTEMAIFRIVQEALTNVAKHAAAAAVEISVEQAPGSVRVTIADDGRGFSIDTVQPEKGRDEGWGMAIMKERAMSIGGTLQVKSKAGCGTEIVVELVEGRR